MANTAINTVTITVKKMPAERLKSLPVSIRLAGVAIDRKIWLNRNPLTPDKSRQVANHSQNFDWGYKGSGPNQLALAILCEYFDPMEAHGEDEQSNYDFVKLLHRGLGMTLIAQLPQGHFHVTIKFRAFILALTGYGKGAAKHPSEFIKVISNSENFVDVMKGGSYSTARNYIEVAHPDDVDKQIANAKY